GEKAPPARIQRELREAGQPLGHVRSGSRNGRILMGGNPRASLEEARARIEVRLLQAQYADLLRRLQAGEAGGLGFDIGNEVGPGPVPLFDVVADLRGTEKPEELVLVGGHLDSWDGAEGAQDNGTGSATTIEAARLIAAAGGKPRRTIRFVLFGGEEE